MTSENVRQGRSQEKLKIDLDPRKSIHFLLLLLSAMDQIDVIKMEGISKLQSDKFIAVNSL